MFLPLVAASWSRELPSRHACVPVPGAMPVAATPGIGVAFFLAFVLQPLQAALSPSGVVRVPSSAVSERWKHRLHVVGSRVLCRLTVQLEISKVISGPPTSGLQDARWLMKIYAKAFAILGEPSTLIIEQFSNLTMMSVITRWSHRLSQYTKHAMRPMSMQWYLPGCLGDVVSGYVSECIAVTSGLRSLSGRSAVSAQADTAASSVAWSRFRLSGDPISSFVFHMVSAMLVAISSQPTRWPSNFLLMNS